MRPSNLRLLSMFLPIPIAAAVVGTPAYGQDDRTIVVEGEREKSEKKVCKVTPPPTGSRMGGRRICRTAFQWKVAEEQSQRTIEQHQTRQRAEDAYSQNAKNGLANQGPP